MGQDQKDSTQQIAQAGQAGLGLPDRDYYLLDNPRQQKIREEYVAHMTRMFELAGDTPEKAASEAQTVMAIETALAQGSMSRTDRRDPAKRYHMMTLADFEKLTPDFDWPSYLHGHRHGRIPDAGCELSAILHHHERADRHPEPGGLEELSPLACPE